MEVLHIFDRKDYAANAPQRDRTAARAVILRDGKLAMVRSSKYGEYKFPGGGVKNGEEPVDAMIREVREETGLTVIPSTVREYGKTVEIRRDACSDAVFHHISRYYFCAVGPGVQATNLDGYEQEYGYHLVWAPIEEAIAANEARVDDPEPPWVARELAVLKKLKESHLHENPKK